jgi:hypothetical protein
VQSSAARPPHGGHCGPRAGQDRAPRWCSADRPAPRPAYYEAPEAYPGLRPRDWCRLTRLLHSRGLLGDDPAMRMARFLADTDTVNGTGVIADVPAMLRAYSARCHVSRQTGYTDLARLLERGLVRQVQAAAPGYPARYRLSYPAEFVDELTDLPPGLASALPHRQHAEADAEAGPEEPPGTAAPGETGDPGPGPAGRSCAGLDPSPFTREGKNPRPGRPGKPHGHHWPRTWGGEPSSEEIAAAAGLLRACRPRWLAQLGPQRVPGHAELGQVERLAALALRHAGPSELVPVLTQMVASASDLPGVLTWRLTRIVASAGRTRHVAVDDEGHRTAAMLAARAAAATPRSPENDAAIAQARAAAARAAALRHGGQPAPARPPRDHFAMVAEQLADARTSREPRHHS